MDEKFWEERYRKITAPSLNPVLVGFNVNLDRIIPVTQELLDSAAFRTGIPARVRERLVRSMAHCTAEEWFVEDRREYAEYTLFFSRAGSLSIGGQAGIAAIHLARLGAPFVTCLAPSMGSRAARILRDAGVRVPAGGPGAGEQTDVVHHIFEYSPGLVPLAEGEVARNNRFILSPQKTGENTLMPEEILDAARSDISSCTRAFLSGYQYLRGDAEFRRGADQIGFFKTISPAMRIHIECVSVTDPDVNAGIVHSILPAADSAGMNEHELSLLLGDTVERSPQGLVAGMIRLADMTGLSRIHLHTFGYYILLTRGTSADTEELSEPLVYAAQTAARSAGGSGTVISPAGIRAAEQIPGAFGTGQEPGTSTAGEYTIMVIPTLIATGKVRTVGLGDIISSTAFAAGHF